VSGAPLRLDGRNVLRCTARRVRGVGLDCDTPVARPSGGQLVVRCRNCHTDHLFSVVDGKIVWDRNAPTACRLPEDPLIP
jgi:hypothetical protein